MSKLVVALVLGFSGLIAGVALSLDNSARPTPAQDDAVYEEWQELDPYAREIVCDLFIEHGPEILDDENDPGRNEAKVDLMERECE